MEHLLIAYELVVIMIGIAVLAIALFRAVKTKEIYLRDFVIVYALFTFSLAAQVLQKYLSLNIDSVSIWTNYTISGIILFTNSSTIAAALFLLLNVYKIKTRNFIMAITLTSMIICFFLVLSPVGTILDEQNNQFFLGIGSKIATWWYFIVFTILLITGYSNIKTITNLRLRGFLIGLLLFASVGYLENMENVFHLINNSIIKISMNNGFLYSSIPYALYGIYLIIYFIQLQTSVLSVETDNLEQFINAYKITKREKELIYKVVEGKSNNDIAAELYISLATVKTHLHNIYQKTNVDSRFALLSKIRSEY